RHLRAGDPWKLVPTLRAQLQPFGLADSLALFSLRGEPLPTDVASMALDLDAAAGADLLINLWHSLPAGIVRCFRRSAFVDTDPGLLQIWMTSGDITVAPHDVDRKSTRLNSSHVSISYAVFCLKKKKKK